jgi:hypothetical protein
MTYDADDRARLSISLDEAVAPCSFQCAAHSSRLFHGRKGADHDAVIDALRAKISAAHDRLAPAKLVREFGPERPKGGVGLGRTAFGGQLNRVGAAGGHLRGGRLHRRTGGH